MSAAPFTVLRSRAVLLRRDDVDTDQIIPARFLTTTEKTGLGRHVFADWRLTPEGMPRDGFALNDPGAAGARILVAGLNFGCGSSREHAPWALVDWGFRAIVAESFADIFRTNAHKNGLLTVAVSRAVLDVLGDAVASHPATELEVDLPARTLSIDSVLTTSFVLDPFVHTRLIAGMDELDYLLAARSEIEAWDGTAPVLVPTCRPANAAGAS